ncbi:MAG: phosphomannose isomerase type II C-terminal cupin domain [Rickettsiales bacterium]|jgi:mannose-6-phosphate isomerase-like protein (cupin superfamily)|nr:phosphomannose isomerase type II C-terminal cupin domain [Rickettsiales bacterium]
MSITYKRGEIGERPWGHWEVLDLGDNFIVKRIVVRPGAALSLQLHHFRAEDWTIASGEAAFTLGEEVFNMRRGQTLYIPRGTQHRIENVGKDDLIVIEVQMGENLDESDIIRLDDRYAR